MPSLETRTTMSQTLLPRTGSLVRADAGLYLLILLYTVLGLAFLQFIGAMDRAAYFAYAGRWLLLFGFLLPAIYLLLQAGYLLHRFDRRRRLAARRMFSVNRMAYLLAGIVLMLGMILFQGTFTSVKSAFAVWQGGFRYDVIQADIDKALHFGVDPWRWLYAFARHDWVRVAVEWNYNMLWFVICFGALFYVACSPATRHLRTRYIVSFMLVWLVVGNLLAGQFLSAGPAFYAHVTGDAERFGPQIAFLARGQWANSAASFQSYIWELHSHGVVGFGSGISAFPSMHIGLITLNALFVWDYSRRLGVVAFAYVAFVLASSVYLAWHYAIDGYASIVVVLVIYHALKWFFARRPAALTETAPGLAPAGSGKPVTAS